MSRESACGCRTRWDGSATCPKRMVYGPCGGVRADGGVRDGHVPVRVRPAQRGHPPDRAAPRPACRPLTDLSVPPADAPTLTAPPRSWPRRDAFWSVTTGPITRRHSLTTRARPGPRPHGSRSSRSCTRSNGVPRCCATATGGLDVRIQAFDSTRRRPWPRPAACVAGPQRHLDATAKQRPAGCQPTSYRTCFGSSPPSPCYPLTPRSDPVGASSTVRAAALAGCAPVRRDRRRRQQREHLHELKWRLDPTSPGGLPPLRGSGSPSALRWLLDRLAPSPVRC